MSDLVRTLAFAFRRKGADAVPGADLRFVLAFDLRWLAPEDAKRAVARGIETGLLRDDGGLLRATFDTQAIEVPLNFKPGPGLFAEPVPADLPPPGATRDAPAPPRAVLDESAPPLEADAADDADVEAERARHGGFMNVEVARLVVARRAGADVREDAARLAQDLLTDA